MGKTRVSEYFDLRMGLIGGLIMGLIVFTINYDHGIAPATTAFLKQGFYTFLAGGFMMKLTENLATKSRSSIAYLYSIGSSTIIAVSLTYILHSLKGTPEPLLSTIPTLLLGPPGFFWWSYRKRKIAFQ